MSERAACTPPHTLHPLPLSSHTLRLSPSIPPSPSLPLPLSLSPSHSLPLSLSEHTGVRNALRKTLFGHSAGTSGGGGGGESKKLNESELREIRERDAKITQLSERLLTLEELYSQLLAAQPY